MNFGQVKVIMSPFALKDTDERLFPASKNRSARIRKKLLKRFGGEFRQVPCIFRTGDTIIAHPVLYYRLQSELDAHARVSKTVTPYGQ